MSTVEDLSNLSILPGELLVKVCGEMDNPTLIKFASTYGRVYQLCSDELKKRKLTFELEKFQLQEELNDIKILYKAIEYYKIIGDFIVFVTIVNISDHIEVSQMFRSLKPVNRQVIKEFSKSVPWIDPDVVYMERDVLFPSRDLWLPDNDEAMLPYLINILRNIKYQGYIKGRYTGKFY